MKSKKIIAVVSVLTCCASILSACGSGSNTSGADTDADLCEFEFLRSEDVEISSLKEHSYFKLNKDEDEFDISNLEFVSENPEIATFSYDSTALGNYIYYNIEPISGGETDVYVKCKECGAESEKLHVIVDLPEATEPVEEETENVETEPEPTDTPISADNTAEENLSIILNNTEGAENISNVSVTYHEDDNLYYVSFEYVGNLLNATHLVNSQTSNYINFCKTAYTIDGVENVEFDVYRTMTDDKGNENAQSAFKMCMTKEVFNTYNFDNLALQDIYDSMVENCETYWMYPSIESEVDTSEIYYMP